MSSMLSGAFKAATTVNPFVKAKRIMGLHDMIGGSGPPVAAVPGPPTVNQDLIDQEAQDTARRRKGNAATVLTGNASVPQSSLAVTQLLGGG